MLFKLEKRNTLLFKRILSVAIPVILQSVLSIGINVADSVMVGQLGETALSATSLGAQFISIFQFVCMGLSMGASILTSRYWGAEDIGSLKKVITITLRITLFLSFLFTAACAVFPEIIMKAYCGAGEGLVIETGAEYLRWSTPTFFLMALSLVCTNILRSVNVNHIPFTASVIAFFVNIFANYVLIFGKLGMPELGVTGAALGTVLARMIETFVICGYFFIRDKKIGYRLSDILNSCRDMISQFLHICIPVMLSDALLGLGDNALAMVMGHISNEFVAAHSITMTVQRISTMLVTGLSYAGCFITGQSIGMGKIDEAKRQGRVFVFLGVLIGSVAGLIIHFIRSPVLDTYNISRETYAICMQMMNSLSFIVIFRALSSVLSKGLLRGGGDTRFLLAVDLITMWGLSIPLGFLFGLVWKLPAFWVFFALHFDHVVKVLLCLYRLKGGKWITLRK